MGVIAEKTADVATLINDLVTTMLGDASGNWTEPDTDITNTGASEGWRDNARLVHHAPSGIYVLLAIDSRNYDTDTDNDEPTGSGVRIAYSNDWDAVNDHPAGKTDATPEDPWVGDVGFPDHSSFSEYSNSTHSYYNYDELGHCVYPRTATDTRLNTRTYEVEYFLSAGADYFNVAVWNTSDGTNGAAGYHTWEYVNNKFWADGYEPFAAYSNGNNDAASSPGFRVANYAFQHLAKYTSDDQNHPYSATGFDRGEWGIVNPDAVDDTYFFKRPVIFLTQQNRVPVGFIRSCHSNDTDEGGSHGDVVTHAGTDYRIFRQSGASEPDVESVALQYE